METIKIEATEDAVGREAAARGAQALREAIDQHGSARAIFASAPSQESMLHHLGQEPGIDWTRVTSFHMDEYLGFSPEQPQAFGQWLIDRLPQGAIAGFDRIRTDADAEGEEARYGARIAEAPIDVAFVGVGVNGHLAFNEPGDTDFADPRRVRTIALDVVSRQQQVDDGLFGSLDEVPTTAITLTVPALVSAATVVCTVLGEHKADAVARAIRGPVTTDCPASALQTHGDAHWFVDEPAAARLGAALS